MSYSVGYFVICFHTPHGAQNAWLSQAAVFLEGLILNLGSPAVKMSTDRYHLLGHFHIPKQKEVTVDCTQVS